MTEFRASVRVLLEPEAGARLVAMQSSTGWISGTRLLVNLAYRVILSVSTVRCDFMQHVRRCLLIEDVAAPSQPHARSFERMHA